MIAAASAAGRLLTVGHIERFNPAIRELRRRLVAGELGRIFQIKATRLGPFPARIRDVGVVVDLAPHDLDVMRFLCGELRVVTARAARTLPDVEGETFASLFLETAAGADRAAFTFLIDAYREEEVRGETRVSLALHPQLAPYKVAVLPLLKKRPEIVELCHRIKSDLKRHMMAVYDDTAAIGKLYRRQDEIGTPWCVTVDVDSLEDGAVTVRDRDSMAQERVPLEGVTRLILDRLEAAQAG